MKVKKTLFTKFTTKARETENTQILLAELLQYFEKQLSAQVVCEWVWQCSAR